MSRLVQHVCFAMVKTRANRARHVVRFGPFGHHFQGPIRFGINEILIMKDSS